jgi:hypothetical protein
MAQFTQHDMSDYHQRIFWRMLRLEQESPLPDWLIDHYFKMKKLADFISMPVTDELLVMVALTGNPTVVTSEKPGPDIAEMIRKHELPLDSTVWCRWRNRENNEGLVKGVTGDGKIRVLLVDRTEEYNMSPENVSLEKV